jgi:hypothetical protein
MIVTLLLRENYGKTKRSSEDVSEEAPGRSRRDGMVCLRHNDPEMRGGIRIRFRKSFDPGRQKSIVEIYRVRLALKKSTGSGLL